MALWEGEAQADDSMGLGLRFLGAFRRRKLDRAVHGCIRKPGAVTKG